MMTGEDSTIVRLPFSQEQEWRQALGAKFPLLWTATSGYCIDAPSVMPAGSMLRTEPFDDGSPLIQRSPAIRSLTFRL